MAANLPVTQRFLENVRSAMSNRRVSLVLIQHLRRDTELFIGSLLDVGISLAGVIGVEYSTKPDVVARLSSLYSAVSTPRLENIETVVMEILGRTDDATIICDVG